MKKFTHEKINTASDAPFWPDDGSSGRKLLTRMKKFSLLLLLMFSTSILFAQTIISVHQTHPTGCIADDGIFNITATKGAGVTHLQYSIDGGLTWQEEGVDPSPNIFSGLSDGIDFIIIARDRDDHADFDAWINNPGRMYNHDAIYLQNEFTSDASCNGAEDGAAQIVVNVANSGGTTPYAYVISPAFNTTGASTGEFTDLPAGTYTITASNTEGCSLVSSALVVNEPVAIQVNEVITDVSCNNLSDGEIVVAPSAGVAPYTVSWTGPGGFTSSSTSITGLVGGTYNVVITDANLCSVDKDIDVVNPAALSIGSVISGNSSCFNADDGTIVVVAAGGTGVITYTINNGADISNITGNFSGLEDDSYNLTIEDANGCSLAYASNPIIITEPTLFEITAVGSTDVSCNGGTDGEIVITATGGTTDYSYSIGGAPQASNTFSGLVASDYTVTASDANSCTATWAANDVTIDEPTAIIISAVNVTDIIGCFGEATGEIEITAAGGTGDLFYSIDDGTTYGAAGVNTFSTLLAGATYNIKVKDDNGCELADAGNPYTITQPAVISLLLFGPSVDPSCFGETDGEIHMTYTGGTGTLEYTISAGPDAGVPQATGDFLGLEDGTYTVYVEDDNACNLTSSPVTLTEPDAVDFAYVVTDVDCNGASTGEIVVAATGGDGTYEYRLKRGADAWGAWQPSNTFSMLDAETYRIRVRDNVCPVVQKNAILVDEPAAVTNDASWVQDATCNAYADGIIQAAATGGDLSYTYSIISPPAHAGDVVDGADQFTGLEAGVYTIHVEDGNGCSVADVDVTINEPTAVTNDAVLVQDATCNGDTDGIIQAAATGGDGTYTYSIVAPLAHIGDVVDGSDQFIGLEAGTYTIHVEDGVGCTIADVDVMVSEPAVVTNDAVLVQDVSCNGGTDGVIQAAATGGDGTYTYSIVAPLAHIGDVVDGSDQFTGLEADTYTIHVEDGNGCTVADLDVIVGEPAVMTNDASWVQDATCNGGADGIIQAAATGGDGTYTYSIVAPPAHVGDAVDGSDQFIGLEAGVYTIHVEDGNGCTVADVNITINEPTAVTNDAVWVQDVACNGGSDGIIQAAATGGDGTYTYSIVAPAAHVGDVVDGSDQFTGLEADTYTIHVEDGNGCTVADVNVTINEPALIAISAVNITGVTGCFGDANGVIDITAAGGTGDLFYSIDDGVSYGAANANIFNSLFAGTTYNIKVKDDHGCVVADAGNPYTIAEPAELDFTTSITEPSCNGDSDGVITISATGGTGAYEYRLKVVGGAWGAWQPGNSFTGLIAEDYRLRVRDANLCTKAKNRTVNEPDVLTISTVDVTDISCNGETDGAIDITIDGGTGPYTFLWTNAATTEDVSLLAAGVYSVAITDANGCTTPGGPYTINEPTAVDFTFTTTDVDCNGNANGEIVVTASGGTGAYDYRIKFQGDPWVLPTQVSNTFSGLDGDVYRVRVIDANGCSITKTVTINEPTALDIALVTQDDITCFGDGDGAIDVTVSGGTPPYTLLWDNGAITEDITSLSVGDYTLTVTDNNGCILVGDTYTILEPAVLENNSVRNQNVTCYGGNDGIIDLVAAGGTGAYTYTISPVAGALVGSQVINLPANSYTVKVTDANGCDTDEVIFIGQPNPFTYIVTHVDATCNGGADGSIEVKVKGGNTGPTDISIDNGATYSTGVWDGVEYYVYDFIGLMAGTYNVSVMDTEGCTGDYDNGGGSNDVTVGEPTIITFDFVGEQPVVPCFGDHNGEIKITVSGGTPGYQYSIDGGTTYQAGDTFIGLYAGFYEVWVKDAAGCEVAYPLNNFEVTERPEVQIDDVFITDVTCFGGSDGELEIIASGGFGALEYSIDGNPYQLSNVFSGLVQGDHIILVKDSEGCILDPAETYTVGVGDNTDPVVVCNPITVELDATGNYMLTLADINAIGLGSTDNCAIATMAVLPDAFTCAEAGPNTVTLTVTDSNGNDAICTTTVTVEDNILPTYTAPVDLTIYTDATCAYDAGVAFTGDVVDEDDNCTVGEATYVDVIDATNPCSVIITRTWSLVDDNGNAAADQIQTITVEDNIIPTFTAPANITIYTDATCTYDSDVAFTGDVVDEADNCGVGEATYVDLTFATNPCSIIITRTWSLVDNCGKAAADQVQTITVEDNTAPTFVEALPADATVECDAVPVADVLTATDNCGATTVTYTETSAAGACPDAYLLTRTWVAEDECTNTTTHIQTITVEDNSAPVFVEALPADATVECDAVPVADVLTATDNCGATTVTYTETSAAGACPNAYVLTRTWVAEDECTNTTTHIQTITVEDNTAPAFVEALPADATVECDAIPVADVLTATDNCGATTVTYTETSVAGTCPNAYVLTRTWVAEDECTNTTTHIQTIEVQDTQAPLVSGGIDDTVVEGCGTTAAPDAQTTVAGLEALAGDLAISDACGDVANFVVTNSDVVVGTCPIVITRTYTVKDECDNGVSFDHIINIDDTFTLDVTSTNVVCNGDNDGTIIIEAIDADCALTYSIDGINYVNTTGVFNGLIPGTYPISVMNVHGCMTSWPTDVVITEPDVLVIDDVLTSNVTGCEGYENASITILASGGTTAYEYSLDNATTWQASNLFEDLAAGDYDIFVRDANACLTAWGTTISVNEPAPIVIALEGITNADCFGNNSGAIEVMVSGGTPGFAFEWIGPNGFTADTESITELYAGDYTLTVTDANDCVEIVGPYTITEPVAALVINEVISTNVYGCYGNDNGSIEILAQGGTPEYVYSINNGSSYSSSPIFDGLGAGDYEIIVKDANGCETVWVDVIVITEPAAIEVVGVDVVNVTGCSGNANGEMHINAIGGTGTLRYSINGGYNYYSNGGNFYGVTAGTYEIRIKDANSCFYTYSTLVEVTEPQLLEVVGVQLTDVSICYGNTNGMIEIAAIGGTGTTTYSIDGGSTYVDNDGMFDNLEAGSYEIFIIDENGCIGEYASNPVVLNEPTPMYIMATSTDVTGCYGFNDGTISIIVEQGTPEYSYSIDGGTTWSSLGEFTDLLAGDYEVVIKDANDCVQAYANNPVTIGEPAEIQYTNVMITSANCFGAADGEIQMLASGGTGVLMYSIDGGSTYYDSGEFAGLLAGDYLLSIMDENGCEMPYENNPVVIEDGLEILISDVEVTNVQCNGELGSISITASGGVGDLMYSIDGGTNYQESNLFTDLENSAYIVRVIDENSCNQLYAGNPVVVYAAEPSIVTITANPSTEVCTGEDVELTAFAEGAVSYTWSNGETGSTITVTETTAGVYEYTCVVVNEEGCESEGSISVDYTGGSEITILVNPENGPYCINEPVQLEAVAENAVSYEWQPGGLSDPIIEVTSDVVQTVEYEVTVINTLGCESMASVEIEYDICESLPELNSETMTIKVYPNPNSGEFSLELTGMSQEVEISIIDFAGRIVLEDEILDVTAEKMEKQFDFTEFERGVYFLRITHGEHVSYKKVVIQ